MRFYSQPASAQQRGYEGNTCNIRGKKPDGIERRGTEHHAVGRNTAITWFEANDATKGRGTNNRTYCLRSQGQGTETSRYGGSRTTARATRSMSKVAWIARRPGFKPGKFSRYSLSKDDCASGKQCAHTGRFWPCKQMFFFFLNYAGPPNIYTLPLPDALRI